MADEENVPDLYIDQFQMNTSPYGAVLNFQLRSAFPTAPGARPEAERKATIRMSLEHLKVMAYMLQRQVKQHEEKTGVKIAIPVEVISGSGIPPEDWEGFWR